MKENYRNTNVAFLHIPKTAGTSLFEFVKFNYPADRLQLFYPPERTDLERMHGVGNALIGHFSYGMQERVFDDCELVTFLRDPVARLISNVHYMSRYYTSTAVPDDHSLRHFFESTENVFDVLGKVRLWYLDNALVRMISGVHDQVPYGGMQREHLERAIENLQAFRFVGFQERFDADLLRLSRRMSLRPLLSKANVTRNARSPAASVLEQVRPLVELDREFYQHAGETWRGGSTASGLHVFMARLRGLFARGVSKIHGQVR